VRCNGYRLCHLKRKFSNKMKGKPRPTTCASPSKCGRLWAAGELAAASLSCTATPQGLQPIEAFHVVVTTASHQSTQPCRLHAVHIEKLLLHRRQASCTHRSFYPSDQAESLSDGLESFQHSALSRRAGDTDILRRRNSYAHPVFPRADSRAHASSIQPNMWFRLRFLSGQI